MVSEGLDDEETQEKRRTEIIFNYPGHRSSDVDISYRLISNSGTSLRSIKKIIILRTMIQLPLKTSAAKFEISKI